MAQFICEKQGRCCPHEFYDSIEQAISDSEDGVPCEHLIEVSPVRHGRWIQCKYMDKSAKCSECGGYYTRFTVNERYPEYCPYCGAKMDGDPHD